jgi:hypothetical protein
MSTTSEQGLSALVQRPPRGGTAAELVVLGPWPTSRAGARLPLLVRRATDATPPELADLTEVPTAAMTTSIPTGSHRGNRFPGRAVSTSQPARPGRVAMVGQGERYGSAS